MFQWSFHQDSRHVVTNHTQTREADGAVDGAGLKHASQRLSGDGRSVELRGTGRRPLGFLSQLRDLLSQIEHTYRPARRMEGNKVGMRK